MRRVVSWGQTTVLVLVGALFIALGASDLEGPAVLQIAAGWFPILVGALAVLGPFTAGVRISRGRVTYRSFDGRPYRLSDGRVEIETRLYAPFVYLHELVFYGPDGATVPLPAASTMSFRRVPGRRVQARRERIQRWIGSARDEPRDAGTAMVAPRP